MHWLTWIGLLFIGIGTAFTIIGQQKLNDKSNELLQIKSDRISELSQENLKLAEKNTELSQQSLNQITGGNSWAYLSGGVPTRNGIANQPFMPILNHVGDNPLYDLKIKIFDIETSNGIAPKSYTLTNILEKDVGTLNKTLHPESIGLIKLPDKGRVDYLIRLNARNGEIIQHWIFIKNTNNCWNTAKKIFKQKPNKDGSFSKIELLQQIDPDFPEKNIEWIEF